MQYWNYIPLEQDKTISSQFDKSGGAREEDTSNSPPRGRWAIKADTVFDGVVWFLSGTVVRAVLRIAVIATLARLLVPADFGLIGAATVFTLIAGLVASTGIASTLVQSKVIEQRHVATAFLVNLLAGIVGMVALFSLANLIANAMEMPRIENILKVLCFLIPLNALIAVGQKTLERAMAYRRIAQIEVGAYAIGYAATSILLSWLNFGVWSLVWAQIAASIIRLSLVLVSQPQSISLRGDWGTLREMLRSGIGFSLANYANIAAQKGDYIVVGRGLGADQLGLYERAYVLMELSNSLLTNALSTVLFSAFSRQQDDRTTLARSYLRASEVIASVAAVAAISSFILAPEIIFVLLGPQWSSTIIPFQILSLGMIFRTGYKVAMVVNNSVGRSYSNALSLGIYALIVIAGAIFALPYGIVGVSYVVLFALAVVYVLLVKIALDATGIDLKSFLFAHRFVVPWVVLTVVTIATVANVLRSFDASHFVVITGCGITLFIPTLCLIIIPNPFVSPNVHALASAIIKKVRGIKKSR